MENLKESFIGFHALLISKLIQDYKNNKVAAQDVIQSIQSHYLIVLGS
jgi:hypothetical protein